jgi:hypothetical protein
VRRRGRVFLFFAATAIAAALYWACIPPLWIEPTGDGVIVHVERLGEYNSNLSEFVIIDDADKSVMLRLVPKDQMIVMWVLPIRDGENVLAPNPAMKDPEFHVQTPISGRPALLSKGHTYKITVKGWSMFSFLPFPLSRSATFVL